MKTMVLLFLLFWGYCILSATFELAPKNAFFKLPTVMNSKADHTLTDTVFVSSIASFSG